MALNHKQNTNLPKQEYLKFENTGTYMMHAVSTQLRLLKWVFNGYDFLKNPTKSFETKT